MTARSDYPALAWRADLADIPGHDPGDLSVQARDALDELNRLRTAAALPAPEETLLDWTTGPDEQENQT